VRHRAGRYRGVVPAKFASVASAVLPVARWCASKITRIRTVGSKESCVRIYGVLCAVIGR